MLYTVTVFLGGEIFAIEEVKGFDAAEAIQLYYAQWPEYEVDIEPNVRGYLEKHTPYRMPAKGDPLLKLVSGND